MGKLRLTSGSYRGRVIETPEGEGTRPLLTRLRKSLADLLRPRLPGARVLDLFGGTGAIALELVSNGANCAVAVELEPASSELLRRNAALLGAPVEVVTGDALVWLASPDHRGERFDVVVVAPPYNQGLQQRALDALGLEERVVAGGLVVVQRDFREPAGQTAGFFLERTRRYGRTVFDLYVWEPAP